MPASTRPRLPRRAFSRLLHTAHIAVAALHAPPQLILPISKASFADPTFSVPVNLGEKGDAESEITLELKEDGPLLAEEEAEPHRAGDEGEATVDEYEPPE